MDMRLGCVLLFDARSGSGQRFYIICSVTVPNEISCCQDASVLLQNQNTTM
jgi:hypothetical protein